MNAIYATALFIFVTATLPLIICLIKIYRLKKYKANAIITTALVKAAEARRGFKNSTYWLLSIEYITIDTAIVYTAKTVSWRKRTAGDTIPLMYLSADPANFKTDFGQSLKWLLPISIILIGAVSWLCYWLLTQEYTYRPES
ncbi:MAG: hypothetical protein QM791_15335 [Ferruginibacter sp.]